MLAFSEGRTSGKDAAENDIVLKRSTDNGITWDPLEIIASDGKKSRVPLGIIKVTSFE